MKSTYFGCFIIFICLVTAGFADKSLTVQYQSADASEKTQTSRLIIGSHLRFNSPETEEPMAMIYRTDSDRLLILNETEKEYFEVNQKTFEGLNNVMTQMMSQFEAQMAGMPEEQKEMMRQNMQQYLGPMAGQQASAPPALKWENTGEKHTIGNYECIRYLVRDQTGVQGECFITSFDHFQMTETELNSLKQFFNFLDKIMQSMNNLPFFNDKPPRVANLNTLNGIPVKIIGYENGQPSDIIHVLGSENISGTTSLFEVPGDYKKASVPF